jgi:rSAM/selenodomain-associated transferase 2
MAIFSVNLSIIVPTLNEADIIESMLKNLQDNQWNFEIIVADGGSSDDTLNIVKNFPDVKLVVSPRGRGRQMNEGARIAKGEILLFLHSDSFLPSGAFQEIKNVMSDPSVVGGCFSLTFDLDKPFLRVYSLFSRINHILFTYGDQGIFIRSQIFRSLGGFCDIPVMEDVEIQMRLRNNGRFVKVRMPVITSARRYVKGGIIKQQILNTILVFFYHLGISPSFLKGFY